MEQLIQKNAIIHAEKDLLHGLMKIKGFTIIDIFPILYNIK